jgi:hypothetical protein
MPRTKKVKVKLVKYTMGATIPTGEYSNLRPEITVEAETLQEAEEFMIPYIEHLFNILGQEKKEENVQQEVMLSEAYLKAFNTLNNCVTIEALNLIVAAIDKSVKLSVDEKKLLLNISAKKAEEISNNGTETARPS